MNENVKIQVENLSKKFGKTTALNNISFNIYGGEIVGFVGPNGAGKTTTISSLLGFIKPSAGSVKICGQTVLVSNAYKTHKKIGYASGDMALFDNLSGRQYFDFLANQYGETSLKDKLMQQLKPELDSKIGNLSRGNKQKIALIGALQHNPEIIILDEPTSGLDPLMQKTFLEILVSQKNAGATIFMSSHILSEVSEVAERVIFLRSGEIIIDKNIKDILSNKGKIINIVHNEKANIKLPDSCQVLVKNSNYVQFKFLGDKKEMLHLLNNKDITDFEVKEETLDDIFDSLYEEKTNV